MHAEIHYKCSIHDTRNYSSRIELKPVNTASQVIAKLFSRDPFDQVSVKPLPSRAHVILLKLSSPATKCLGIVIAPFI